MKKKILIIGIVIIIITGLFIAIINNNNNKELVLKDEETGYTTTFKYSKNQTFEITNEDKDSGKFVQMTVENKANNIELEMYYFEQSKSSYDSSKDSRKDDEGFKEYKWNNYEGYIYNVSNDSLYFNILLKDETEDNLAIGLFGSVNAIDYNEANIPESFNSKEFQNFMKSTKFKIEK